MAARGRTRDLGGSLDHCQWLDGPAERRNFCGAAVTTRPSGRRSAYCAAHDRRTWRAPGQADWKPGEDLLSAAELAEARAQAPRPSARRPWTPADLGAMAARNRRLRAMYLAGDSYETIAKALGISPSHVGNLVGKVIEEHERRQPRNGWTRRRAAKVADQRAADPLAEQGDALVRRSKRAVKHAERAIGATARAILDGVPAAVAATPDQILDYLSSVKATVLPLVNGRYLINGRQSLGAAGLAAYANRYRRRRGEPVFHLVGEKVA